MMNTICRLGLLLLALAANNALAHGKSNASTDSARQISFPDTAEHLTLTFDPHTHSVFSDGHVWPKIRVDEALRDGLDALAITEHLEWQPHLADIPHGNRNRAYDEAAAAAEGTNLLVVAGSEITREAPAGHINAVFIEDANKLLRLNVTPGGDNLVRDHYADAGLWPAEEAVAAANEQGAFVFWNHPYWTRQQPDGKAQINSFHRQAARNGQVHGIEIANGDSYSEEAFQIALDHNLTLIGVSDVHDLIDWDYAPHKGGHRPVTLVLASARTQQAMREALFERRTVVWFKNLLLGRPEHLNPLLAASLQAGPASWVGESKVVKLTLTNTSDARWQLRNTGKHTFAGHGDLIEVPAQGELELQVKPHRTGRNFTLQFDVLNALVAPKRPATVSFEVTTPE